MSVEISYGIEKIEISKSDFILLEKKAEDGYTWFEVTFKSNDEHIFIGSYYTYNYGMTREWLKYNTETIAIAKEYIPSFCIHGIQIERLFDIKTRRFIEGSQEDLLNYYNQQFCKKQDNKMLTFKKN